VILGSGAQPAPLMPPDGPMGAIQSRPGTLPTLAGTPRPRRSGSNPGPLGATGVPGHSR